MMFFYIGDGADFSFELQIEKGTKTDFIPHQSQKFFMPIQQEMLEGDYIDDKEYHRWGKVVFDENSDVICERSGYGTFTFKFLKKLENTDNWSQTICNMSKHWKNIWKESGCFISYQGYFYLLCKENEFVFNTDMTTDEALLHLREILAQTNLVVYYTYSSNRKPKTIALELTEEQKKVKKEIDDTLHTYKNTTHIFSTNELSPIFNVEYLKDTETYIENKINAVANAVLELEGNINV